MKKVYPAIFTETESIVLIEVPDFEILTEGKNIADAVDMARDAIGLKGIIMIDQKEDVPEPSAVSEINASSGAFAGDGESFTTLIDIDFDKYRRQNDNRTVRRNVTLPNWLNQEAESAGVNVSKILQEALSEKLEVYR